MKSTYLKFSFVAVLVVAAFLARASQFSAATSQANMVNITASSKDDNATSSSMNAFVPNETALADGGVPIASAEGAASPVVNAPAATSPFTRVGDTPPPSLDYHEALIADIQSGAIFFGDHDADRWPLASVTKLMTAIVTEDAQDLTQQVTITPQMLAVDPTDATLKVGDIYTVSDLLHIMLLQSSNVAAEALASVGGRTQYLATMNARASSLHMTNTFYGDPSGLSSANQSTADDLLLLAQTLYANYPQILAITRTPQYVVKNIATGKNVTVRSINAFAGTSGFIGGKTGYTTLSDGNLLSMFNYQSRPVLVIIMGTDDAQRFNNTTALYNWFKQDFK